MTRLEWAVNLIAVALVVSFMVAVDWSERFARAAGRQLSLLAQIAAQLIIQPVGFVLFLAALWASWFTGCTGTRCRTCVRCYRISYLHSPQH